MDKKDNPKKEDFVKIISSLTPQELNEFIKNKGKQPKIIEAIWFED